MNESSTLLAQQQALLTRIQSLRPTPYRLKFQTQEVYVFCAYDALLYTLLTQGAVTLEAEPPKGEAFTVGLAPEGPERLDLWHSFTHPDAPLPVVTGMPSSRCPYLHLFERREDAEGWRKDLPETLSKVISILPLETAWRQAREQVEALGSAPCEC